MNNLAYQVQAEKQLWSQPKSVSYILKKCVLPALWDKAVKECHKLGIISITLGSCTLSLDLQHIPFPVFVNGSHYNVKMSIYMMVIKEIITKWWMVEKLCEKSLWWVLCTSIWMAPSQRTCSHCLADISSTRWRSTTEWRTQMRLVPKIQAQFCWIPSKGNRQSRWWDRGRWKSRSEPHPSSHNWFCSSCFLHQLCWQKELWSHTFL